MPRWQMEVVELSDRAGGTEMVLQGEREEGRGPNPSQKATDSHLPAARARFAIKRGGEGAS